MRVHYLFLDKLLQIAVFYCIRQSIILLHVRHSSGMGLSFSRFLKYPKKWAHPVTVSFSVVVALLACTVGVGDCGSWMVFGVCGTSVMHLGHA